MNLNKNFKLKYFKFCCIFSIMTITVLMSILMKAISHTYNLEKMLFKCFNLNFTLF